MGPPRRRFASSCSATLDTCTDSLRDGRSVLVAQRLARICIEDSVAYAHKRKVFGKRLIDSEVIRNKVSCTSTSVMGATDSLATQLAHMARVVESQQTWIEARRSCAPLLARRH